MNLIQHSTAIVSRRCYVPKRQLTTAIVNSKEYIQSCKVLVVGGGTGGCALSAKLSSKLGIGNVIVLEPADKHYYQPLFTLIGGGMKKLSQSYKDMKDVLSKKVKWIKESAVEFDPKRNCVVTSTGRQIKYDILLLAMGLQLNYDQIPGLTEALSIPNGNVTSIYSPKYVSRHFEALKRFEKGNCVFSFPASSVKCPGAPQKVLYISEDYLRRHGKRESADIIYNTSLPVIFGVKYFADALWKVVKKRDIHVNLKTNLVEVNHEENIAVFENLDTKEKTDFKYSILHATPPMSAPEALRKCSEITNATGFVDVNPSTMQNVKYANVFAIGDCSGSPNSKTAASAAAQSPVVYDHILSVLNGKPLTKVYDGYASCPLVTGYNSCILAEFDYTLQPLETFPFKQNKERYSMFFMKKELMPMLYWNLVPKGLWDGPAQMRRFMSNFKISQK